MKSLLFLGIVCFVVGVFGMTVAIEMRNENQREYTIIVTRTPPPAQIIGRIQVGLTKAEAEGAAFQLNELFSKEKLEWKAEASLPEAIK